MSPAFAAKEDSNSIIGGTIACSAYYKSDSIPENFNNANWKFKVSTANY
ncbi:MAG: hypothetical protein KZQ64_07300 [gamma proteobacterium symbiont of Bathyaustriella thionipta]|nr:hypothetical protein [gamma proteobacterium symbiont of Bathyaustriella thionipta]MCU7951183.1 hypothetical protein [gamma proteobacterium symbiont of Bathyaustriella thionipta]MCU7953178.1 hypothetical protein [gamma proteobacterium symbiont of Bathyaustriella thionipta]MCU7957695.1 hypothetical protein [gamma proteobacterium symbiont of Bathyaustriella thionipta]MCU7967201.1 hypothetical protein [gamma proteobacterium symbiont of Bathyaustriella thionipta]